MYRHLGLRPVLLGASAAGAAGAGNGHLPAVLRLLLALVAGAPLAYAAATAALLVAGLVCRRGRHRRSTRPTTGGTDK